MPRKAPRNYPAEILETISRALTDARDLYEARTPDDFLHLMERYGLFAGLEAEQASRVQAFARANFTEFRDTMERLRLRAEEIKVRERVVYRVRNLITGRFVGIGTVKEALRHVSRLRRALPF
ncbi:MAG: hypothetical protein QXI60_03330 [Thermofilaceae archaeon]